MISSHEHGLRRAPAFTLADVYAARQRIAPHVRRTPLIRSAWLSSLVGADVRLKLESLQVTNSFKARGAVNAALRVAESVGHGATPPVLVTASAGNHGRALAYAAERVGLRTIVFTPKNAPRTKLDAIKRHGADLRDVADSYEETEILAKAYVAAHPGKSIFVSPYSHPDLISAIGTIAIEAVEDFPEVDTFLVPVGGGGLVAGVGLAAKSISSGIRVVGVESEASQAFTVSLREGRITEVPVGPTIADGLAGNMDPETITFELAQRCVDEMTQVSEAGLADGIRGLASHEHLIAEGAGAAPVGAILGGRLPLAGRCVAVIVSGGNIDAARLAAVLAP
jgi:threonine dehydratase